MNVSTLNLRELGTRLRARYASKQYWFLLTDCETIVMSYFAAIEETHYAKPGVAKDFEIAFVPDIGFVAMAKKKAMTFEQLIEILVKFGKDTSKLNDKADCFTFAAHIDPLVLGEKLRNLMQLGKETDN